MGFEKGRKLTVTYQHSFTYILQVIAHLNNGIKYQISCKHTCQIRCTGAKDLIIYSDHSSTLDPVIPTGTYYDAQGPVYTIVWQEDVSTLKFGALCGK